MDRFIIPAKFYTFSDFIDPDPERREDGGDSGKLLVAVRKLNAENIYPPKLLIKHCFSNDAGNEFMASHIASLLGVPVSTVYLIHCPDWKKNGFTTRYICGINYIEGLRNLTKEERHSRDGCIFLAKAYALSALLHQADQTSVGVTDICDTKKAYYTYDLVETFLLGNFYTDILLSCGQINTNTAAKHAIVTLMKGILNGINMEQSLLEPLQLSWTMLCSITGEDYIEEKWSAFIGSVRRFCFLSNESVKVLVSAICRFYGSNTKNQSVKVADVLGSYYREYLVKMRSLCLELIKDENKLMAIKHNRDF